MWWAFLLLALGVIGYWSWGRWQRLSAEREAAAAQREAEFMLALQAASRAEKRDAPEGGGLPAQPAPAQAGTGVQPGSTAPDARPRHGERGATPAAERALAPRAEAAPAAPQSMAEAQAPAGEGPACYLGRHERLLYLLLRTGLPSHEIFLHGSLRRLLGARAPAKDLRVDAVVCDARLRPVAVVDLQREDDLPPVVDLKRERFAEAGIRYLRWAPSALPKPAQIADLIK